MVEILRFNMGKPKPRCQNTSNDKILKKAIDKVMSKKFSLRKSSEVYNVPKSTLFDYIKKLRQGGEIKLPLKKGRFDPTFTEEYEEALIAHVVDMSNKCMPLTRKEFLKLAFDLAEQLKLNHRFNMIKKSAGKHFYYDFIKRHPHLSLRRSESTSLMRAVGFNRPQVQRFFNNLKNIFDKYNFSPSDIYNYDKTGVSTVQKQAKVMTLKSNRQIGMIMKPFKDAYFEACGLWIRANSGARITEYEIAAMVSHAFTRVARFDIAKSGFQCTGILPLNPNIFIDLDFLPSTVTDVPVQSDDAVHHKASTAEVNIRNDANRDTPEDLSQDFDVNEKESVITQPSTSKAILTVIHQLSPVPSAAAKRVVSRQRKAEKSEILTSSPYKNALIKSKATKAKPPVVKMQQLKGKKTNDPTKVKRSNKFTATPKTMIYQTSVENATTCLLCQDDNDEDWICCQTCNQWAYEACADVEKGSVTYICDFCRLYN